MADIRIKDLASTATTTASDDFMAVDGTTNGTRKMNAAAPAFLTSVTTPSLTSPASTNLTLTSGLVGTNKVNFPDTLTASSSTAGAVTIGNGTAATNVAIGGGNINAGGTITGGSSVNLTNGSVNSTGDLALTVGAPGSNYLRLNGPIYSAITNTGTLTHEFINNSNTASAATEVKISSGGASALGAWLNITDTGALNWVNGTLRSQGYFVLGSNGALSSTTSHGIRINTTNDVTIPNGTLTVSDTTASTSTTTGALVIGNGSAGGLGVGGASVFGSTATFAGAVTIGGNVGFYNASPVAKPTGVAVTAAAIHAALVTLNLIAA